MKISIATEADDQELKVFYESFPIHSAIELSVRRPIGFLQYYKLQSEDSETHILRNSKNQIIGCATLIFRNGQLKGQPTKIGYATDLRIAPTRSAIVGWARYFLPVTKAAAQKRNATYLFSVLSKTDSPIYNTLLHPRAQRRNIPVYSLLRKFEIITIVGHLSLLSNKLPAINLVRATENDLESLISYLQKKSKSRALAFTYSMDLLNYRFKTWPGLRPESFILAKNRRGHIVGCVAPWSTNAVQRVFVNKYTGFAETAKIALKIGSWFNISTTLPASGSEVLVEHLTHFYADNPDVFESLLTESYHSKTPRSLLVYPHFDNHVQTRPPKSFLVSRTPSALYTVSPVGEPLSNELLHSPLESPPELELCLI